jgi:peptidoglycan biosynthesis protein MviN/MurJ (putative lipid II flippase)
LITLLIILRKRVGAFGGRAVLWTYARVVLASAAGGAAAYGVTVLAQRYLGTNLLSALTALAAGGATGLAIAYGAAALMRVDEINDAKVMLGRVVGRLRARKATA